jgi:hypothetical protein
MGKFVETVSGFYLQVGGAGVGSYCRDSLKHILWRSILGFLPRTVPAATTHPCTCRPPCITVRSNCCKRFHKAEGVQYLASGPYETGMSRMSAHGCFTACPEARYCAALAPMQVARLCAKLTGTASAYPCARSVPFIPQGTLSTNTWSHLVLNIT